MRKILIILMLFCFNAKSQTYENYGEFTDTLIINTIDCYLYENPHTIYDKTGLINLPKETIVFSNYFSHNYYCIEYDGEVRYIFCLDVITPTRIKKLQKLLHDKE
jgi:hypothetical protein